MKLLVIERDPLVRRWLHLRARDLGVRLRFVGCGNELMEAIGGADSPDCVVMDAATAAEGELWHHLRERSDVPILLYSSSCRWQPVAEEAGRAVDGYIPRPFTPEVMVNAARRVASGRLTARGVREGRRADSRVAPLAVDRISP